MIGVIATFTRKICIQVLNITLKVSYRGSWRNVFKALSNTFNTPSKHFLNEEVEILQLSDS